MPIADVAEPERKVTRSHSLRYSSLKDFKFDVPDGWDDRNIAIFLESCFANLEALRKYTVTGDEATWKEVARSGLEKSGSIKCFTVNCCLELSNCLKNYVAKKGKEMMDNVIFKQLHADVEELLPYWQTPRASTSASPSTPRSDPKPFEKLVEAATADQTTLLAVPPFTTSDETEKAVRVIALLMKEHYKDASSKVSFRNSMWKEVVSSIEKDFGVSVDPRQFLESYKTSIVRLVNQIEDVVEREKSFLELVNGLLPYFDSIPPKSIKKMEFIVSTEVALLDRMNKGLSSQKPSKKNEEVVESGNLILTLYESSPTNDEAANHSSATVASEAVDCPDGEDAKKSQPPEANHILEDISLEMVEEAQSLPEKDAPAESALEPTTADVPEPGPAIKRRVRRKWLASSDTPVKRTRRMAALEAKAETVAAVVEQKPEQTPANDTLPASVEVALDPKIGAPSNQPLDLPSSSGAASDSDDADESCLLGTNILPHRGMADSPSMRSRDNMNPIVVLDKSVAERYLEAALSPRRRRTPSRKLQSAPKRRASPISTVASTSSAVSTSTSLVPRRRGRPPKNRQPLPSTSAPSALINHTLSDCWLLEGRIWLGNPNHLHYIQRRRHLDQSQQCIFLPPPPTIGYCITGTAPPASTQPLLTDGSNRRPEIRLSNLRAGLDGPVISLGSQVEPFA
ncbi:unnamed protein product [Nesidiocoris tenuis]|uniref:Uncharacterized protein n=1 Tax=Nesidiocoris tenuis TaxID=355587 RepID=A0A6H5GA78_9HEMI|nr:unnamed protein product [Nesidiocoris tenuis]